MFTRPSLLSTMQSTDVMGIMEKKRNFAYNTFHVEHDNVKITPPYIEFVDTSEGHVYEKMVTINNCGYTNAFIRIDSPKSIAFHIDPIKRKTMLAPGLSIRKKVTYHYSKATHLPYSEVPIYINEVVHMYPLIITNSDVHVEAIPQEINFGELNISCVSSIRAITLRNLCGKTVRFVADRYVCQDTLDIEPSRGVLKPKGELTLCLQLLVDQVGPYNSQFWIKCANPVCVKVSANIIQPRFEILHPIRANERTMFLNFGKTYFGATVSKTIIIQNYSASKTIFCTAVKQSGREMVLREAIDAVPDMNAFHCVPTGGQFYPMETKTITVSFTPIKPIHAESRLLVKEYFQWFKFVELNFNEARLFEFMDYDLEVKRDASELKNATLGFSSSSLADGGRSLKNFDATSELKFETRSVLVRDENNVVTLVYAEAFSPDVSLLPSEILVKDLQLMDVVIRVINMKNNNEFISIYFQYKPTAYVQIQPANGCIKAQSQLDLLVKVTASEPGKRKVKIVFELLYPHLPENEENGMQIVGQVEANIQLESTTVPKKPLPKINHGITPVITHEVGFLPEEVSFDTNIPIPNSIVDKIKSVDKLSDIIAFPNDMPKSLRPRRNVTKRCTTIFAKIPRTVANWDEYDIPDTRKHALEMSRAYFDIYFERMREMRNAKVREDAIQRKRKHELENYTITDWNHLLLLDMPKETCPTLRKTKEKPIRMSRLPMSPEALFNFKVHPSNIILKRVLVDGLMKETITLQNLNDFSVFVAIRFSKSFLKGSDGKNKILKAHSSEEIEILFTAPPKPDLIFIQIEVIVNENHFSEVAFIAQVVDTMVQLHPTEAIFQDFEDHKIVTIKNLVRGNLHFKWKLNSECFRIVPMTGFIPSQRNLKCAIYKKKCICIDTEAELSFLYTGIYKTISFLVRYRPSKVFLLNDHINLPNVPLNTNVKKSIILRNAERCCVTFAIVGYKHIRGLTVIPDQGILERKSDKLIDIIFHFTTLLQLDCTLTISVANLMEINLKIDAKVVYPFYHIQPNELHLRKITCFSTNSMPFVIVNKCSCRSKFRIPLDEVPEYEIKEMNDYSSNSISDEGFYLNPGETKKLCLFFTPKTIDVLRFNLPVVVNDILGPPVIKVSENCMYFIERDRPLYENIDEIVLDTNEYTLQTLTIASTVTHTDLDFSKINFTFEINPYRNGPVKKQTLIITNVGDTENEFCIRIDDTKESISILHSDDEMFEDFDNSVSAKLNVGEKAILDVVCNSTSTINKTLYAPVFVRNYPNGPLFTYLSFKIIYKPATINPQEEIVFFPPVPPCCGVGKTVTVELINHPTNCQFTIETDLNHLIITVGDRIRKDQNTETVSFKLFVYFKANGIVDADVNLACSCGSSQKVGVKGCADNCFFTIHGFMRVFSESSYENIISSKDCEGMDDTFPYCVYSGRRYDISNYTCPLFPNSDILNSKYYIHMKITLETMEHVVFSQAFHNEKFLNIPEGFSTIPAAKIKEKDEKGKKNEQQTYLYYEQFLKNLLGNNITSIIWCGKKFTIPADDIGRVNRICDRYSKALAFLTSKGATLPYVYPEYLLSYDDYTIFVNQITPETKDIHLELTMSYNEEDFYLRSKQCWLDLILQTYKVVILFQIRLMPFIPNRTERDTDDGMDILFSNRSEDSVTVGPYCDIELSPDVDLDPFEYLQPPEESLHCTDSNFATQSELIVLKWLEKSYNAQIKIWNTKLDEHSLEERQLTNFNVDLEDGLVLLATISLYCPFFNDNINDIYFSVESLESRHHNAIIIMEWLQEIHTVVMLSPEYITDTKTGIYNFILCVYLFEFLPPIYPQKTISLEANINKSASCKIAVSNKDKEKIMYNVTLFKNEYDCVSTSQTEFIVLPKKSVKVKLTFSAKFIRTIKVFVLLNGESKGYRLAKCMSYWLEGIVKFDHCTATVKLPVPIYNSVDVSLPIRSPYAVEAKYQIFYNPEKMKNSNSLKVLPWKTENELPTLPSRISSEMSELICNQKGVGILKFRAYCFSETIRIYLIFFTNDQIGDFCVELRIVPNTAALPRTVIPIEMSEVRFSKTVAATCTCETHGSTTKNAIIKTKSCPKIINIQIPCLNDHLWTGVGKLFSSTVEGLQHWSKDYAATSCLGSKLVYFAVDNVDEECRSDIVQLYRQDVEYKLICNTSIVTLPNSIFIKGVRNIRESVDVSMHINANKLSNLNNFSITLISDDLLEKRYYNVVWTFPRNFNANSLMNTPSDLLSSSSTDVDQE